MAIHFDWSSGNRQAHQEHKPYPEDDEVLKREAAELVQECVDHRESADLRKMPFLEAGAHIKELRHRGYDVEVDTSGEKAVIVFE